MTEYAVLLAEADAALRRGVDTEAPDDTWERVRLTIGQVGQRENLVSRDAGPIDWASSVLAELEDAIREELCDATVGKLKKAYEDNLDSVLKPAGVARLASVILSIVQTVNPALAVSSVGVYIAVWLLKVGLNHWCQLPKTS
jgi:hypothetical protein